MCDERIVQDSILFKAISNVLIGDVELIKKLYQDLECLVKLIRCIYMPGFFWNGFKCNAGKTGAVITDNQRISTYWSPEHYPIMIIIGDLSPFPGTRTIDSRTCGCF